MPNSKNLVHLTPTIKRYSAPLTFAFSFASFFISAFRILSAAQRVERRRISLPHSTASALKLAAAQSFGRRRACHGVLSRRSSKNEDGSFLSLPRIEPRDFTSDYRSKSVQQAQRSLCSVLSPHTSVLILSSVLTFPLPHALCPMPSAQSSVLIPQS
jgi:hypothetical protein